VWKVYDCHLNASFCMRIFQFHYSTMSTQSLDTKCKIPFGTPVELFECILPASGCVGMGLTSSKDMVGWRASRHGIGRWQGRGGMEGIASRHASMELASGNDGARWRASGHIDMELESTIGRDKRTRQVFAHEGMELDESDRVHTMLARSRWPTRGVNSRL